MFILSNKVLLPKTPEYLRIDNEEHGLYFYIHRRLYDQAVILQSKFGTRPDLLIDAIGGNSNYEAIKVAQEYLPEPLNFLGYFLALLVEDTTDINTIVGSLHYMLTGFNFDLYLSQPVEIRKRVFLPVNIRRHYEPDWAHFTSMCFDYDEAMEKLMHTPFNGNYQPVVTHQPIQQEEPEETEAEYGDISTDDLLSQLLEAGEAEIAEKEKKDSAKSIMEDMRESMDEKKKRRLF